MELDIALIATEAKFQNSKPTYAEVGLMCDEIYRLRKDLEESEALRHNLSDSYKDLQETLRMQSHANADLSSDILNLQTLNDGLKSIIKGIVIYL